METSGVKLLRLEAVLNRVAYKRSSIYHKIKEDKFPKPRIQRRGFTAWHESDIDLYLIFLENENKDISWSEFLKTKS